MPLLLLSGLALLIASCALLFGERRRVFWLTLIATATIAAAMVLTITQLEPLNQLANSWRADQVPATPRIGRRATSLAA